MQSLPKVHGLRNSEPAPPSLHTPLLIYSAHKPTHAAWQMFVHTMYGAEGGGAEGGAGGGEGGRDGE
jgi:hypothetical protein